MWYGVAICIYRVQAYLWGCIFLRSHHTFYTHATRCWSVGWAPCRNVSWKEAMLPLGLWPQATICPSGWHFGPSPTLPSNIVIVSFTPYPTINKLLRFLLFKMDSQCVDHFLLLQADTWFGEWLLTNKRQKCNILVVYRLSILICASKIFTIIWESCTTEVI